MFDCCPNEEVARRLALNWGVYPVLVPMLETTDEVIQASIEAAKKIMPLNKGDIIVITGGLPNTGVRKSTNIMKIEEI